jgi:hypothetical protein
MFTGIVTDMGRILELEQRGDLRARIGTGYDVDGIDIGASIACEGVCLTVVALGCIIRGETTHYDTVCNDSSRGLTLLGLQGLCIGNGILTVENYEQAAVRAQADGQNKGGGAAAAALHLIALERRWGNAGKTVGFTSGNLAKGGETV